MPKVNSEDALPSRYFWTSGVIGAVGEARIVDPVDARIGAQEVGDLAGVLDMALDAQRHGLDPLQQQEGVERRQHRADGALSRCCGSARYRRSAPKCST